MLMHQHLVQRMKTWSNFDNIDRAISDSDSEDKIITRHINAQIGTKLKAEDFKTMGASSALNNSLQ